MPPTARNSWLLAFLTLALTVGFVSEGDAQKKPKREGFFSRLFGPSDPSAPPSGNPFLFSPNQKDIIFFQGPKRPRIAVAPPVDSVIVQAKDPKARKILVIGDFVAGGLASGLDQSLANEPKLVVIDKSNNGSGLVRKDYFDWNATLPELLNTEKPDIVIFAIGSNDRQQMRLANQRLAIRSEPWEQVYTERINGLIETLKVYGRPYLWVGAPPVRNGSVSADMAYLNGLFKARVEAVGGTFVDIWNGFADANGEYISAGPDIEGQVRSLRTGDGVNFTRAGRLKLSFFVERDLRRKTGVGAGTVALMPSVSQESQIEIAPDGRKVLVGPVISLTDPLPTAGLSLAGAAPDPFAGTNKRPPVIAAKAIPTPTDETLRFRVIVKGETTAPVAGRVDDFAWPPRAPAPEATVAPSAAAAQPDVLMPIN